MLWQLYEPRIHGNCSIVSQIQYCRRNAIYISLFVLIFFFTIIFRLWLVLILRVLSKHNFDVFIFLLRNSETSISTQYRNPRNIVLPQKSFLVIKVFTTLSRNCAINSSQPPDYFLTKIEQFSAPKSRLNFYFEKLKL